MRLSGPAVTVGAAVAEQTERNLSLEMRRDSAFN